MNNTDLDKAHAYLVPYKGRVASGIMDPLSEATLCSRARMSDLRPAMTLPPVAHFLDHVFAALDADGVDAQPFAMDHLCFRVATTQRYDEMKALLSTEGTLLGEHSVGGRPIATYALHVALVHRERRINVIELPAPKPGSPYPEGWEHAEFVIDVEPAVFASRYPQLPWDLSGADKPMNACVRLNYDGCSVKFRRRALADVIMDERS